MDNRTLYERLHLPSSASPEDIKRSFRELAKRYHPDTNDGCDAFSDEFKSIIQAYETLIDPFLRNAYDQSIREALSKAAKKKIRDRLYSIDITRKIEIILAWSTTRPAFNTSFSCSCLNHLAEGKHLTHKQEQAIDNIIASFQIDIDKWNDDALIADALDHYFRTNEDAFESYSFKDE